MRDSGETLPGLYLGFVGNIPAPRLGAHARSVDNTQRIRCGVFLAIRWLCFCGSLGCLRATLLCAQCIPRSAPRGNAQSLRGAVPLCAVYRAHDGTLGTNYPGRRVSACEGQNTQAWMAFPLCTLSIALKSDCPSVPHKAKCPHHARCRNLSRVRRVHMVWALYWQQKTRNTNPRQALLYHILAASQLFIALRSALRLQSPGR